ncbi:Basic leucine zipper (bZIP) transcription factor atfB [Apiospora marii]|uniref:Basic leucine zipper (BZIP) transcription factor atfB n=1 Tax=Apiospora marii TaxID=335849 RepID=A0ABR1RKH0_9PEZI
MGETIDPVALSSAQRLSPTVHSAKKEHLRARGRSGSSGRSTDISREKNCVAASKCRRKKKNEEHALEERRRMLHTQNAILVDSVASLRAEVLSLKHEILRHGACDFQPINSYISIAAARVR